MLEFKAMVNVKSYQNVIKKKKRSNKSLFGSRVGEKGSCYKTIAHKNTASLKNNQKTIVMLA